MFALFLVYGTTIPFNFSSEPGWAAQKLAHVPLNPFIAADTGGRISIPDFVQNVLLFLPFGVLGALRLRSPRRSRLTTIVVVCGLGAALSLGIEALQLLTVDRTSAVSDIVANTFGALVGVIGAQLGENVSGRALKTLSSTGVLEQPSSYGALVAAIALCVAAWQPFDATLDVGSLAPRVRALMSDPWQAGPVDGRGHCGGALRAVRLGHRQSVRRAAPSSLCPCRRDHRRSGGVRTRSQPDHHRIADAICRRRLGSSGRRHRQPGYLAGDARMASARPMVRRAGHGHRRRRRHPNADAVRGISGLPFVWLVPVLQLLPAHDVRDGQPRLRNPAALFSAWLLRMPGDAKPSACNTRIDCADVGHCRAGGVRAGLVRRSLSGPHGRRAQRRLSDRRRPGGQPWGIVVCGEGSGRTL